MAKDINFWTPASLKIQTNISWSSVFSTLLTKKDRYTRHGAVMSTLGFPLYLANNKTSYSCSAKNMNNTILDDYSFLLNDFFETLEPVLMLPIKFDPRLAVPGFHIFNYTDGLQYSGGVWHSDVFRYEILPTPICSLSATLLIGDETTIYGINYISANEEKFFRHTIGSITLFNSLMLHRIAPVYSDEKSATRITLQAHLWLYDNHAIAFW